jgi:hypothetical protein
MMTPNELAVWWLHTIKGVDKPTQPEIDNIVRTLIRMKRDGYTSNDIISAWQSWKHTHAGQQPATIDSIFNKDNLITKDKYYHPRLMIIPKALISSQNDDGDIVHHNLDSVEIQYIQHFTINNLIDYYYSRFPTVPRHDLNRNRDRGAFAYLLKKHTLDELLFIIDAAAVCSYDEDVPPPRSPLDVCRYEREGIQAYLDKAGYQE